MTIEAILDQCLQDIRERHASIADCLARHSEHAKELEPLLRTALALEQAAAVLPAPEFKQGLRERILGFSKTEETNRVQDLFSASDAAQKSDSEDNADAKDQETPTSVSFASPAKQRR